jgi:hypothetical protein
MEVEFADVELDRLEVDPRFGLNLAMLRCADSAKLCRRSEPQSMSETYMRPKDFDSKN